MSTMIHNKFNCWILLVKLFQIFQQRNLGPGKNGTVNFLLPLIEQDQSSFIHIVINQHNTSFCLFNQFAHKNLGIKLLSFEKNTLLGYIIFFQCQQNFFQLLIGFNLL
jgi:hypothetical protein